MDRMRFGIIGLGQGGGNIANTFSGLGFNSMAINTSQVDLDLLANIPSNKRMLINLGVHGAGKNPEIGRSALEQHIERVAALISQTFTGDTEMILVCAGLGGGTGSGSAPLLLELLCDYGYRTGAIITIPSDTESIKTKTVCLGAISDIAAIDKLGGVFIIDNGKSLAIPKHVGVLTRYNIINENIVSKFEVLSRLPSIASTISFDKRDLLLNLALNGCAAMVSMPVSSSMELKTPDRFIQSIVGALTYSIFADTDISHARSVTYLFEINSSLERYINEDFKAELASAYPNADINIGLYLSDDDKKESKVHMLVTGLPYPQAKIMAIKEDIERREADEKRNGIRGLSGIDFGKVKEMNSNFSKETELNPAKQGNGVLERILKNRKPLN